jgi:DnaJ-class molecular chaperone
MSKPEHKSADWVRPWIKRTVDCPACHAGEPFPIVVDCDHCGGTGQVPPEREDVVRLKAAARRGGQIG